MIGYGSDDDGNAIIAPAFIGSLAGRDIASVRDLADNPARLEVVVLEEENLATPPTPIRIDARTQGCSPRCHALLKACEIIDALIPAHQRNFPPLVINVTDHELAADDTAPLPHADALKQRATDDGEVLFFNCCLAMMPGDTILFPSDRELMPEAFAKLFFAMSSILPPPLLNMARRRGHDVEPHARGMAYNADTFAPIGFLRATAVPSVL